MGVDNFARTTSAIVDLNQQRRTSEGLAGNASAAVHGLRRTFPMQERIIGLLVNFDKLARRA